MDRLQDTLDQLAAQVARRLQCEVYDLEMLGSGGRKMLRVTIDRTDGVSLGDCESFSRDFEALLDVEDPIQGRYTLEVSSPGLDRPLKRPGHYASAMGKLARVVTKHELEGATLFVGRITFAGEEGFTLALDDGAIDIAYEDVRKARLEVEI